METEKLGTKYPRMWRLPVETRRCCIYRVPTCLREVNEEAYTPRLVLIGPLQHALKAESRRSLDTKPESKFIDYLNTEETKKLYLLEFSGMLLPLRRTVDDFRTKIEQQEQHIRDSYSESTAWINSKDFCDMILSDAVFIILFLWKSSQEKVRGAPRHGDPLLDIHCLEYCIKRDLLLLENQLPYYILHLMFAEIVPQLFPSFSLLELVMQLFFSRQKRIVHQQTFLHFTDLMRGVHVLSLPNRNLRDLPAIKTLPSTDLLCDRGVKFEPVKEHFSINVRFENGCLKIPVLSVDDHFEVILRNLVALEQCHYPHDAHVCSYLTFIDFLIDTDRDVELLAERGIITSWVGKPSLVTEMMNKLRHGINLDPSSCYSGIANQLNAHYKNPIHKSCSFLKRNYFGNVWTGTATSAAAFLLILTFTQTLLSYLDYKSK